ncbi:Sulfatase [Beijerinckiaceae bacterium RH AL1]|nr:arylsulfatase [Beijerinckiaceae bacterium]VVB48781.1 Sulfatase [Beijerinckiaceae bacterium RH CH11]VVB48860.1 Sulfatase [Beijerinckiaceae bacterium RH AL8]VVC56565.1 Sulfatase [Beijerinckiaceae bacterium RH AL1]
MRKDLTPGGTAPGPGDSRTRLRRRDLLLGTSLFAAATALPSTSSAQPSPVSATKRPNILVIMADDVGWFNVGAYNKGMMHYKTPNIDRLAQEGVLFTDYYGEQSCTAGRSAFITGQSPFRTGLTKVGLPGSKTGLQPQDPTIAEMLKPFGYATGQFGKNHLGDRDEFLPTAHGFDEFFGNLYHLNAEEEPENPDYPKSVAFKERFGPRGVLHSYADGRIEDTGPLTMKRMETVDEEFLSSSLQFIDRAHASDTPFFVWFNSSRMHIFTHLKPASEGKTGLGVYADGMVEHDGHVGQLLKKLDDLGIADDTIVLYTTDNGAETFSWPDGGTTPFRGEKNTNWEGGYRVPALLRWPGTVRPGTVSNEVTSALDWFPTFVAAAGAPGVKEKLLAGYVAGNKTFKVHLDGYDLTSALKDAATAWPRKEFFYFSDDGDLVGLRYLRWKAVFAEQRAIGFDVWQDPLIPLRVPKLFDLWGDPFERADHESSYYADWRARRVFLLVPAQAFVAQFLQSFKDFPPRQKPPSFSIDQVLQKLQAAQTED